MFLNKNAKKIAKKENKIKKMKKNKKILKKLLTISRTGGIIYELGRERTLAYMKYNLETT